MPTVPTVVTADAEGPTKQTTKAKSKKKTAWKNDGRMMEAVKKWDDIYENFYSGGLAALAENVEWKGEKISEEEWTKKIFTRYRPSLAKYSDAIKIPYNSLYIYACCNKDKRKDCRPLKKWELEQDAAARAWIDAIGGKETSNNQFNTILDRRATTFAKI